MPRAEHYGDLITADHKVLSEESESRNMPWWYKTWPHSGYNHTRANKIFPGDAEELDEVPGANEETKSTYTDNSLEFDKFARIYPVIIARQYHTDRRLMGLLKKQCAERKMGHLRCCCSPVWVTNGGRSLWNAIAICEHSTSLV